VVSVNLNFSIFNWRCYLLPHRNVGMT
jgi:hypothetical protein